MIERTQHGDVTAFRLSWRRSRVVGYSVFVYSVNGVLVDCGFSGIANEMTALLAQLRPRGAFLTHQHEDHAGNVELLARLGIPIAAHPRTFEIVRERQRIAFYRRFTWESMPELATLPAGFHDDTLSMIATPGHCDDHQIIWDNSTGTLFAGDLYLGVKVRVAHRSEDPRLLVQSLRAMVKRQPARVFCGHRGLVANGVAALLAKADWLSEIIAKIERHIAAGWPDESIRREVLGPRTLAHYISAGEYSPINLVRAVRNTRSLSELPIAPHVPQ